MAVGDDPERRRTGSRIPAQGNRAAGSGVRRQRSRTTGGPVEPEEGGGRRLRSDWRDDGGIGDASGRSGGGGWEELDVGVWRLACWRRNRRRRPLQDDGDHRASSLPLFPITEFLAREFQGPLSWFSWGGHIKSFIFISKLSTRYSLLSSLYRREKETGCPKGNPVIRRGFGPKIG